MYVVSYLDGCVAGWTNGTDRLGSLALSIQKRYHSI